ncbi:MAG: hypothetical protein BWX54_01947 [Verrucomicrobia bacterium ADurb.Bin018]|nr:MAG: hypothetical protein BWX54_01947 [Verrucomicrobia bacterium ADurb.Bin018]
MKSEGRIKMEAAETAMRAARAADELLGHLARAETADELATVKRQAYDLQGIFPLHAARFAAIVADINERENPRPDPLAGVKADTEFLVKDRKAQKKRRGKAARQTRRDTKDSGLWDPYDTFRAMRARIERGEKRLAAATDVIEASKGKITLKPETLVRYYRAWKKKRKTD